MPSVSTFVKRWVPGGEGGGVFSAAGPPGRATDADCVLGCNRGGDARGALLDDDNELTVCDRLTRLGGGAMSLEEADRLCEREPLPGR